MIDYKLWEKLFEILEFVEEDRKRTTNPLGDDKAGGGV